MPDSIVWSSAHIAAKNRGLKFQPNLSDRPAAQLNEIAYIRAIKENPAINSSVSGNTKRILEASRGRRDINAKISVNKKFIINLPDPRSLWPMINKGTKPKNIPNGILNKGFGSAIRVTARPARTLIIL